MNFFQQQDIARKNTRLLMVLFVLAVFCLLVITNLFLAIFPWQMNFSAFSHGGGNRPFNCLFERECDFWASIDYSQMRKVSFFVVTVITCVSLYKWHTLKAGGKKVAEMLGGVLVSASTHNIDEQRLINVVEEMALAAHMPVPAVYVLADEEGINAFAAGFSPKDAVIAVTQGTLKSFNREQLQGVIAHEFSHILNGDMRLNMKIISVLYGITFITEVGHMFLRGTRNARRERSGPTFLLGLGLVIIGSLGTFFGLLIKAAVSRQREYLADASAVQFTRNPEGITEALRIIGGAAVGSYINDAKSYEISHLFFGECLSWLPERFATHPPLAKRIRLLDPNWDGSYLRTKVVKQADNINKDLPPITPSEKLSAIVAAVVISESDFVYKAQLDLHEPFQAAAAIACLLIQNEHRDKQHSLVEKEWSELYLAMQNSKYKNSARKDFLPIVELATSGLRSLSVSDYEKFKFILLKLIDFDGVMDIYEWSLFYLLTSTVDSHFGSIKIPKLKYKKPENVAKEMRVVLSMLVVSCIADSTKRKEAYAIGIKSFGIIDDDLLVISNVTMIDFNSAISTLSDSYPLLKSRIIKALVECAKSDGVIELTERNTIMAIAALLDTPIFNLFDN